MCVEARILVWLINMKDKKKDVEHLKDPFAHASNQPKDTETNSSPTG